MDLEKLKSVWKKYTEKLPMEPLTQEEAIKIAIHKKVMNRVNYLIFIKAFLAISMGISFFYFASYYYLYINDYKYTIPFIIVSIILLVSFVFYVYWVILMLKININTNTLVLYAKAIGKIRLAEKWEMLISLIVAVPLMLICLPPLTSLMLNRIDFYTNMNLYLPKMLLIAVLSVIGGLLYYWKNYRIIKEMQKYLNELEV